MSDDRVVFSLSIEDFREVAKEYIGRDLTEEEREMILSKFVMEYWVSSVEDFFNAYEFRK